MSQSSGGRNGGDDRDLRSIRDRLRKLDSELDTAAGQRPSEAADPSGRGEAMGIALRIST